MQSFLVEVYLQGDGDEFRASVVRFRVAAKALTSEGSPVRYRRSLFLPEDETGFHILEADSSLAVEETARRAAVDPARVVEALQ